MATAGEVVTDDLPDEVVLHGRRCFGMDGGG
jgi:hypothetical protein